MRLHAPFLALVLLASSLLLAPAQGALVEHAECAPLARACFDACLGPDCAALSASACADGGLVAACAQQTARACVPDAACADVAACADAATATDGGVASAPCVAARLPACDAGAACPVLPCDPEMLECAIPGPTPAAPRPLPGATACNGGVRGFAFRLDTGETVGGASLSGGSVDPVWKVGPAAPSGPAYAKDPSDTPGSWVDPVVARWITPYPGSATDGPIANWVYGAAFAVPPTAYGVSVTGRFSADNEGSITLGSATYASPVNAFTGWTSFSYGAVPSGAHLLTANVHNSNAAGLLISPTGLVVEAVVEGRCATGGPGEGPTACSNGQRDFQYLVSTGLDPLGTPMAPGNPDPHWNVDATTAWTVKPNSAWVVPGMAAWISPTTTAKSQAGVPSYAYETSFWVPANAYDVRLVGRFAADNRGMLSVLDTVGGWPAAWIVAQTPTPNGFGTWTDFDWPIHAPGAHPLYGSVHDDGVVTGFVLEAMVIGKCRQITDGWLDTDEIFRVE